MRRRRGYAGLLAVALVLAQAPAAPAADDGSGPAGTAGTAGTVQSGYSPEKERRLVELKEERKQLQRKYMLRSRTGRLQLAATRALDEEDPAKALEILSGLTVSRLNPFEAARTHQLRAYAAYASGDPTASIAHFRKAIAEATLSVDEEAGLRFNVAQLEAAQQNWPEVVDAIHEWFAYSLEEKPIAHYLLAVAYYQTERPDEALEEARRAIDLADEPKEGWLTLLAALHVSKEQYDEAIPVFEELVLRYPKKQYWVQLSLLWGARENYEHALAVQQIAYRQGLLTEEKELVRLARSYLYHELPYPAATVLQKGIDEGVIEADVDNLELLANSWIGAREYERSLAPLGRAAEISADGNLLVRLGQVYMQREDWTRAAELLQRALERGGLDDAGNAQLLLGISFYNDEQPVEARAWFARAAEHEKVRSAAEGWLTHIERESRAAESGTGG